MLACNDYATTYMCQSLPFGGPKQSSSNPSHNPNPSPGPGPNPNPNPSPNPNQVHRGPGGNDALALDRSVLFFTVLLTMALFTHWGRALLSRVGLYLLGPTAACFPSRCAHTVCAFTHLHMLIPMPMLMRVVPLF